MLDYKYLYKKLNKRTPLKTDCGALCSNACCVDTDGEELGMYLFPYEEEMFLGKDNFKVEKTDLEYAGKKAAILYCKPYCKRNERPLSCRIFPLFPYITVEGDLKVIVDPRGRTVCPLYKKDLKDFNPSFVRGVRHLGMILIKDEETYEFLFELSRQIDMEVNDIIENLSNIIKT